MSHNIPQSFAPEAPDNGDHSANDHDHSQAGTTKLAREIPDSQSESQALFIHRRFFPSVILDSQATQDHNLDDSLDEGLEYDYDFLLESPNEYKTIQDDLPNDSLVEGSQSSSLERNLSISDSRFEVSHISGREIPDSQEYIESDSSDRKSSDGCKDQVAAWLQDIPYLYFETDSEKENRTEDATSCCTESTEVLSGGTKLTRKRALESEIPDTAYPLHKAGFGCNGRLPIEDPRYRDVEMEDVATQPTTQPQFDDRRLGASGQLSKQDEADIIAILHPASPAAHVAVNLTADSSPQHILQNSSQSHVPGDDDEIDLEPTSMSKDNAQDIALRFSSRVNHFSMGFVFGRNVQSSDILLVRQERKEVAALFGGKNHSISNKHFRIFVNKNGMLMLEDTSTNGTIVDGVVLHGPKAAEQSGNLQPQRMLCQGAIIELPVSRSGESIRFVVNIPSRDFGESKYSENLNGYLAFRAQAERKAAAVAAAQAGKKHVPSNVPLLTNALPDGLQQQNAATTPATFRVTGGNNYGLHWNGGETYNVVGYIGSGAFATVCKLSSKRDGEVFAVKQLEKQRFLKDNLLSKKFHNELNLMMHSRHPNIIEYIGHHETNSHLFIIMEFIPFGDLRHWTDSGKAMPEYMAARLARQMLDAITYLHAKGITHRDIKPDNILVGGNNPDDKIFKLTDFGLSKQVMDDQTFLQTFCGTILYLAPEVYPGYDRAKLGLPPLSKRARGKVASYPYQHSVDIWSLGTVLYQLLTGKPPYRSHAHDNGDLFLTTVMNIPVDYERLVYGGMTKDCINFISRMLVTDPQARADDDELSRHVWLIPKEHPTDETDVPDASQLSLADENDDGEMEDPRRAKRVRDENWKADDENDPNRMLPGGLPLSYFLPKKIEPYRRLSEGPPPPQTKSEMMEGRRFPNALTQPERLFGEIGSSALRSSGVLGQNANMALGVSEGQPSSEELYDASSMEQEPSEVASAGATHVNTPRSDTVERALETTVQYPQLATDQPLESAAPSLLGAETLVGQLNMASRDPEGSPASTNSKPTTPKGTVSRDFSPQSDNTKRPIEAIESTTVDPESKRPKTKSASSSNHTHQPSAAALTQHHSTTSKSSGKTSVDDATASKGGSSAAVKGKQKSAGTDSDNHQDGQQPSEPATNASFQPDTVTSQHSSKESPKPAKPTPPLTTNPSISLTPSIHLAPPAPLSPSGFTKPPLRFGTLFLLPHSIPSVPRLAITSMGTSYGRAFSSTYRHPQSLDRRIPKNAFDIQMWYSGIEKDLAAGKNDWAAHPDLTALIRARTTVGICVNGVRVKHDEKQKYWQFGKLRTGDIVSVVELKEGQVPKNAADREFLKYRCEFYVGASRAVRREGEPFVLEKEEAMYKRYMCKMSGSREGSMSVEQGEVANDAETQQNTNANAATGGAKDVAVAAGAAKH